MNRLTAFTLLVAVALVTGSCSQSDKPQVLRFKYTAGRVMEYSQTNSSRIKVMETDSLVKDSRESVAAEVTQTVARVLGDGTAQIDEIARWSSLSPSKTDSTSLDTTRQSRESSVYTAPNGKIVDLVFKTQVDSASAAYLRNFYDQNSVVFPDTAVGVGGSWTQRVSVMIDSTQMEASTTYHVVRSVVDAGYDCLSVSYEGNLILPVLPMASDTTHRKGIDRISMSGTFTFAPREGIVVSVREKWSINGDREKTISDKVVKSKVTVDTDVAINLKSLKN
ncbi:MAG: hypothetical protein WAU88_16575 [Candidatus Zixiibacteriota bacterium]